MKVLLKKDVDNLGYAGEIFEVAAGYGRNYLIPQGLAIPATDGALRQAETWIAQAAARREQLRKEYAALTERLNGTVLTFLAASGEKGRLYGSITTSEIAEKLQSEMGLEIDRKKISVDGKAIRQLGNHPVTVRLDAEFQAIIRVAVLPENPAEGTTDEAAEDAEDVEATEDAVEDTVDAVEDAVEAEA